MSRVRVPSIAPFTPPRTSRRRPDGFRTMSGMASIVDEPLLEDALDFGTTSSLDEPWRIIVWNDSVNLMQYVTRVFQTYFGYPRPEAERLMREVHEEGRAVVAAGPREEMERHTEAMHEYGLWATAARG